MIFRKYNKQIKHSASGIQQQKGMMNIGVRPTVDGTNRVIEVNIFDFDEEIYGLSIKITVKKWLRSEVKFSGLDALKVQLAKDKIQALEFLVHSS